MAAVSKPTPKLVTISAQATCQVNRPIDCCMFASDGDLPPLVIPNNDDYDSSDNEEEED